MRAKARQPIQRIRSRRDNGTENQNVARAAIVRLESPLILWKLRVKQYFHCTAARYCSSDNPTTRPVATSSIRRMPSLTASVKDAGSTTLSTRRRASSRRSSGGNPKAVRDSSVLSMMAFYLAHGSAQAFDDLHRVSALCHTIVRARSATPPSPDSAECR